MRPRASRRTSTACWTRTSSEGECAGFRFGARRLNPGVRRILQISDVHFGPHHLPELSAAVIDLIAERRPDFVAISGDMTLRAKPHQFQEARAWVDRFDTPSLAVPGNHDVPLYRVFERALFPHSAYRKHFDRELEPTFQDDELHVVGVNTAFNWTFTEGRIKLGQLKDIEERISAAGDRVKIVVAHHPLIPPPWSGSQRVLRNAPEAIETLSRAGVELVFSGHRHVSYIGNSELHFPSGSPPLLVVCCGTTTSARGRSAEKGRNSCNWVEVDDRRIVVTNLWWELAEKRFVERTRHSFPRRHARPYQLEEGSVPESTPTSP